MTPVTNDQRFVLVADDDPGDQELTRRAFLDAVDSPKLYSVGDGEEVMDFLLHRNQYADPSMSPKPDLVLLDLNMPKLDGRVVLQQIRNHPDLRELPVVVFTTSKREEDVLRSYELGCNSFITKPLETPDLMRAVREVALYWFGLVTLPYRGQS